MVPGTQTDEERARAAGEALLAQRQGESAARTRSQLRRLFLIVATMLLVVMLLYWLQQ